MDFRVRRDPRCVSRRARFRPVTNASWSSRPKVISQPNPLNRLQNKVVDIALPIGVSLRDQFRTAGVIRTPTTRRQEPVEVHGELSQLKLDRSRSRACSTRRRRLPRPDFTTFRIEIRAEARSLRPTAHRAPPHPGGRARAFRAMTPFLCASASTLRLCEKRDRATGSRRVAEDSQRHRD